jgi:hypothetical protein
MVAGMRDRTTLLQTPEACGTNSIITTAPFSLNARPAFLCGEKTEAHKTTTPRISRIFTDQRATSPSIKR